MYLRSLFIALIAGFTPSFVYAFGIGDITLQSNLGDPLRASIDLMLEKGDTLEDKCLSLVATEDSGGFVPTGLTARLDSTGHKVVITSRKPFDELFAVFRLQIKCSGMGSISKTFALLPEVRPAPPPLGSVAPARDSTLTPSLNEKPVDTARASEQHAALDEDAVANQKPMAPEGAHTKKPPITKSPPPARPRKKTSHRSIAAQKHRNVQFRLKLSGGQLDTSRIGMLTPEQHESLLAQQLLLDEDDQTAHFLSMQHQLKLLQEELSAIKLKLATLESAPPADVKAPGVAAAAIVAPLPKDQGEAQGSRTKMVLGFFIASLIAWLGFRYFGRTNYQTSKGLFSESDSPVIRHRPESKPLAAARVSVDPAIRPAVPAKTSSPEKQPEKQAEKQPEKQSEKPHETGPERQLEAPAAVKDELADSEEYSILEEAEFYAVYGHPDKGVKILKEYVAQHPQSEKPWMWMLSIFSSRKQLAEFEATARAFLQHNKNSAVWKKIQEMGRAVDKNNPLYVDENPLEAVASKRENGSVKEPPLMSRDVRVDEEQPDSQAEKNAVDKSRPLDFG